MEEEKCGIPDVPYPATTPGTVIRGLRGRDGLTQQALAKLAGIPHRHISEMENGKRPSASRTRTSSQRPSTPTRACSFSPEKQVATARGPGPLLEGLSAPSAEMLSGYCFSALSMSSRSSRASPLHCISDPRPASRQGQTSAYGQFVASWLSCSPFPLRPAPRQPVQPAAPCIRAALPKGRR